MPSPTCTPKALMALLAAAAPGLGACLSDYGSDCDRNVDLQCFWDKHGGNLVTGGEGGAGGAPTGGGGEGGAPTTSATTTTTTSTTEPPPECGNGQTEDGEACDDGNTADCDGCRGDCSAQETGCGDGFVCGAEACDDKNTTPGDGCFACEQECTAEGLSGSASALVYTDTSAGRCYVRISASPKSWTGARTQCSLWGGDLVGFGTTGEMAAVSAVLFGALSVWTGGKGTAPDMFTWSNSEPWPAGIPWGAGQPNSSGEACLALLPTGTLDDQDCATLNGFVCERPLVQ